MKKTIIALFALAGVAMGVETLVTLDSEKLAIGTVSVGGSATIGSGNAALTFSVGEKTSLTAYTFTFGFDAIPAEAKDPWLRLNNNNNNQYGFKTTSSTTMVAVNADWSIAVSDSFTINTSDTFALTVSGSNAYLSNLTTGDYINYSIAGVEQLWTIQSGVAKIYTNGNVNKIQVGEVADLSGLTAAQVEEVATKGTYTVNDAVPEPTTATLSLLALAGLAARRRRR